MNPARLIYGLRDADKYLYHYTTAEIARDYIIKSNTLRLNTLGNTNDPREYKDWEFGFWASGGQDLAPYNTARRSPEFSRLLKSRARLACFSRDMGPMSGDHTEDIRRRGLARSRMWAQYANVHKGVCLVFDRSLLIDAAQKHLSPRQIFCDAVVYRDHYLARSASPHEFTVDVAQLELLGLERYAQAHLMRYRRELFFEKVSDWRDEAEWRLLAVGLDEGPLFLPLEQSLVGIFHGASIDPGISDELIVTTQGREIEHMALVWMNGGPWYDLGRTRWSASDRALLKWKAGDPW